MRACASSVRVCAAIRITANDTAKAGTRIAACIYKERLTWHRFSRYDRLLSSTSYSMSPAGAPRLVAYVPIWAAAAVVAEA
jgi:hypothetical protein